jgi:hypothetical protein
LSAMDAEVCAPDCDVCRHRAGPAAQGDSRNGFAL